MRHRDAYVTYLLIQGLFSLFFYTIITVNMVYQVEVAHLNPLQLVLVGTMLEIAAFLSQVPTGVLADVFSRRWSIIIGIFLTGAGFVLEGSIPQFGAILLSQLGWGIGSSFISGAEEAWIADEVGEDNVGRAYMRGSQIGQVGALIGAVISVALASIRLNLPIILGGILFMIMAVCLLFFMPEHYDQQSADDSARPTWSSIGKTFRNGGRLVRASPLLLTIVVIPVLWGLSSEGLDRLWTAHIVTNFTLPTLGPLNPVTWFAVIRGGVMIAGIIFIELVQRRFKGDVKGTIPRLLLILNVVQIACILTFALAGNFALALISYGAYAVLRGTVNPIYSTWLTQNSDAKVRATIISMSGQLDAIGQIVGGPIVGVIGTLISIRAALLTAGALLGPVLILFMQALRLEKKDKSM
ncbi:MAG: MFS transporter [Ktedonobacteraceae bacterium]|nr:MFS transporter [Ktedonobacteraceae bacterium]